MGAPPTNLQRRLADAVARCLARHEGGLGGRPLLAAVSGGADSTALALAIADLAAAGRLPGPAAIAHVDHAVRAGSADDARAVERLATRLQLGFVERRLAPPPATGETALREARLAALRAMADEVGAAFVLTAHHADDDLETVLFRMLRGTGPRGLCGIPEARPLGGGVLLLRPFLRQRRQTLRLALATAGVEHREDPTNASLDRSRNRIRHLLVPQLRARDGVRLDASLLALKRCAEAYTAMLETQAARLLATRGVAEAPWRWTIDVGGLPADDLPFLREALRQIHRLLRPGAPDPTPAWLRDAVALVGAPAGRRRAGPGMPLVERTRAGLLVVDPDVPGAAPAGRLPQWLLDGRFPFGATGFAVDVRIHDEPPLEPRPATAGPYRALLDLGALHRPLAWRTRRPGDRCRPLGAAASRDLRRLLQARGVPRFDRDRLPLLVDASDRIVWVPGAGIADGVRVRPGTTTCVELRLCHRHHPAAGEPA